MVNGDLKMSKSGSVILKKGTMYSEVTKICIKPVFIVCICIIGFLYFYYNVTKNIGLFLGASLFLIGGILCFPFDASFLLSVIFLPSIMMIKIKGNTFAFYGLFLMLLECRYFLNIFYKKNNLYVSMFTIFFTLLSLLTTIIYYDLSLFSSIVRSVTLFTFISNYLSENKSQNFFKQILFCYVIGCVLCLFLGILYYVTKRIDLFAGGFSGINNDRNFFSAILASGIATSLYCLINKTDKQCFFCLSMFFLIFGGLLTSSRTFVLAALLLFGGTLLFSLKRRTLQWFGFIAVVSFVVYLVFPQVLDKIFDTIGSRFSNEDVSGGNGRYEAWIFYLKKSVSSFRNFLLGSGSAVNMIKNGEISIVEHNSFVQVVFTYGYISAFLYFLIIKSIYHRIKIGKFRIANLMPLLALLFCYFSISAFLSDNFNFGIIIMLVIVSNPWNEQMDERTIRI